MRSTKVEQPNGADPHSGSAPFSWAECRGHRGRGVNVAGIPGYIRSPGYRPSGSCGCLVVGLIFGLLTAAAFLYLVLYVTRGTQDQ